MGKIAKYIADLIKACIMCVFFVAVFFPIWYIGLDSGPFDAPDCISSFAVLTTLWCFLRSCVLNIGGRVRNGGVWVHMEA